jgi:hypothetical protein
MQCRELTGTMKNAILPLPWYREKILFLKFILKRRFFKIKPYLQLL